jgi:hypothetical protein
VRNQLSGGDGARASSSDAGTAGCRKQLVLSAATGVWKATDV